MSNYLSNSELLKEIVYCKGTGKLTNKAVEMFILLAERVVSRLPYADDYLREEAESGAKMDLLLYWNRFDPTKSTNAFAYLTQICKMGAAKSFNKSYKFGKKFKGKLISMSSGWSSDDSDTDGIYSI